MSITVNSKTHINLDDALSSLTTDKVLKVGWPKNTRYPEEQGGKYIAEIAAQNEYGAPHKAIPARPFLGPAVADNKNKWLGLLSKGVAQAILGNTDILEVLDKVGTVASDDVAKAIKAVTSPPLAPSTIAARKARYLSKAKGGKNKALPKYLEKPLIDTGIMFAAITHAVEDE